MKRSRFSEAQVIGILREHPTGGSAQDLSRGHGISDTAFCNWRRDCGGMDAADAKRPKALEAENAKPKKMLAEQMLDVATLNEMLEKTAKARFDVASRGRGHEREELLAAAGLCAGGHRSACLSAQVETSR